MSILPRYGFCQRYPSNHAASVRCRPNRERSDSEARLQEQLAAAARRGSELDGENRRLRDAKYELDSRVSELSHKLGAAEGTVRSLEEECSRLRAAHKQAAADKHSADIQLNEARAKVIALEEKVWGGTDRRLQHYVNLWCSCYC